MKRLMVIDQNNMFLRHYIVDPSLATNGDPIGGLQGSLKGLQKLLRDIKPNVVIVCWDGAGGSQKRKQINGNYKGGREPVRLNRNIKTYSNEQLELENKVWQMTRLSEYYDEMPLLQFLIDDIEADDIIAYVCQMECFKDWQKVVVSSDKDFIQLLNKTTILFRPIQKEIKSVNSVIEEYGIHPNNFVVARSIVGDESDNLGGVKGVGLKTVAKRLPFLVRERNYSIPDVIEHCKMVIAESKSKKRQYPKAYRDIVEQYEIVIKNYKMMQLSAPSISVRSKKYIDETIMSFNPTFNKTEFRKMMLKDGFAVWNWDTLFQTFNRIVLNKNVIQQ